jgi:hypothetical protein
MEQAGARVPKMATPRFSITTSPEPANFVHTQNACEGDAGYLASLAFGRMGASGRWHDVGQGERHCCTQAQRSHPWNLQ